MTLSIENSPSCVCLVFRDEVNIYKIDQKYIQLYDGKSRPSCSSRIGNTIPFNEMVHSNCSLVDTVVRPPWKL